MTKPAMRYFILAVPEETVELLTEQRDPRMTETEELTEQLNEPIDDLIGYESEFDLQIYECADDPQTVESTNNVFTAKTAWSTINGAPLKLTVLTTKEKVP
jgi:uncharacterized protein YoxC